jgi:hypothetical protein
LLLRHQHPFLRHHLQVASGTFVYGVGYGICVITVAIVKIPWLIVSIVPCIIAVAFLMTQVG